MTEETAGAETPAADGATPEATADNAAPAPAQHSEADDNGAASASDETGANDNGDDAAAAPKRKHWAHERIDELTRQRREAERQAEYWKAKASQAPNLDDLDYDEQIAARVAARNRQEMAESAEDAVRTVSQQVYEARVAEVRDRYADFDTVVSNPSLPITNDMAAVIMDSERGPEVAYHLGKNPAEAARIARLSPVAQAKELGRLEERLSAPKPLPKQPPTPVQPVNGIAAGGSKDPGKMSMSEYAAWRKANA
jgi:hypothetical protein